MNISCGTITCVLVRPKSYAALMVLTVSLVAFAKVTTCALEAMACAT